jgi:hypothetical protein
MRHRVGGITKTFTAAAVLQPVESGQIGLDKPIGYYLPQLVPGEVGNTIAFQAIEFFIPQTALGLFRVQSNLKGSDRPKLRT